MVTFTPQGTPGKTHCVSRAICRGHAAQGPQPSKGACHFAGRAAGHAYSLLRSKARVPDQGDTSWGGSQFCVCAHMYTQVHANVPFSSVHSVANACSGLSPLTATPALSPQPPSRERLHCFPLCIPRPSHWQISACRFPQPTFHPTRCTPYGLWLSGKDTKRPCAQSSPQPPGASVPCAPYTSGTHAGSQAPRPL